jgi:MOSC domain-containing protein YiiM
MSAVVSIHVVSEQNGLPLRLSLANFVADQGLEGDCRSRQGRTRQVTIIEAEALEQVAAKLGLESVPPGASRRQVVVRGVDLNAAIGKHLRIGPVLIAVNQPCDPCSKMEIKIGPGAREAMKDRGGVCGRVVEGGAVRPGDSVEVID